MGTGLRSSLSYHRRLFLLLLAFSWALVACFIVFQYGREKQFKAERLDTRLQLFNLRMLDALADGATPEEFIAARGPSVSGCRSGDTDCRATSRPTLPAL